MDLVKAFIRIEVKGKPIDVRFTADPPKILRDRLWDIFSTTFPPGKGANKDFADVEEFNEILNHRDTYVAYCVDGEDVAVYAVLSRNEGVIFKYAKRDIVTLSLMAKGKSIFWVFLFCPNGPRRYFGAEAKALFEAVAQFVYERKGVIFFDEDPRQGLSDRIGRYLSEVGDIHSTPHEVQTLQTTMLSLSRNTQNGPSPATTTTSKTP